MRFYGYAFPNNSVIQMGEQESLSNHGCIWYILFQIKLLKLGLCRLYMYSYALHLCRSGIGL